MILEHNSKHVHMYSYIQIINADKQSSIPLLPLFNMEGLLNVHITSYRERDHIHYLMPGCQ